VGHLAIAGRDGTLATRLTDLKPPRVVRAKTGTLDDVVALSGYVLGPGAGPTLAFSFLLSGVSGKQRVARDLLDGMVRALVASLYP
jgi:serine-type D-Ala-D-Ala carboxypeptidase/endopeptidase (penicillin-binding protein 4)